MLSRSDWGRSAAAFGASLGIVLGAPAVAGAAKVVNGGFETGSLAGWHVADEVGSAGTWFAYSGTTSPLSFHTIYAPPDGTYAAITDQTNPSSNALYQNVKLARHERHLLSFILYYQSYAPIANPPTLDYNIGGGNQQYRVDVMKTTAPIMSVASSDIYRQVFATQFGAAQSTSPTQITANLSSLAGKTVRLRFAIADNENYFNAGVDAVMIVSNPVVKATKATKVKAHSATLHGRVNPNGGLTTYRFQWGTTKHYGHKTTLRSAGTGATSEAESAHIKGLKPGVTYHYRIVAYNAAAKSHSKDRTFTTP